MTNTKTPADPIATAEPQLGLELSVGEPDIAGSLAVFPLFGPEPRQVYLSFREACERGARVHETPDGASVNKLVIENPLAQQILLYPGEQVQGAQQDRIFDSPTLVPAKSRLTVTVNCVEQGRWDASRHDEDLEPAPEAAHPGLRRQLQRLEATHSAHGAARRQAAVWDQVEDTAQRSGVETPTGAMSDVFAHRRERVAEIADAIPVHDGQCGAIAALGGRLDVLDCVSRPESFAHLHPALVRGYALDALDAASADPPAIETARGFTLLVNDCPLGIIPSPGNGEEVVISANGIGGFGLRAEGEVVQLTAFAGDELGAGRRRVLR